MNRGIRQSSFEAKAKVGALVQLVQFSHCLLQLNLSECILKIKAF